MSLPTYSELVADALQSAGMSRHSDLEPEQLRRAQQLAAEEVAFAREDARRDYIMHNRKEGQMAQQTKDKGGRLTAREAALKVLSSARNPLSAAEVAKRMLKMDPPPVSGKYAQANAQKAVYALHKAGEIDRTEDGFTKPDAKPDADAKPDTKAKPEASKAEKSRAKEAQAKAQEATAAATA